MADLKIQQALATTVDIGAESMISKKLRDAPLTIEAEIVEIIDPGLGRYRIKYHNNNIEVSSNHIDVLYEVGDQVQVYIPNRNWEGNKIILGLASSVAPVYATEETGNVYVPLGSSLLTSLNYDFNLCSYKTEEICHKDHILNNGNYIDGYFKSLFAAALKDSRTFNLTCKIQTNIEKDRRFKGDYGLILEIPVIRKIDGEEKEDIFKVEMNTSNITGDPYGFSTPALQNIYFTFPEDMVIDTKDISIPSNEEQTDTSARRVKLTAFVKDFLDQDSNSQILDIFLTDVQVLSVLEISKDNMSGYHSVLTASLGNCFYDDSKGTDSQVKTISVNLYLNGRQTNVSKFDCYWFRENININNSHNNYHKLGGLGWEILNKTKEEYRDESGKINYVYQTNIYTQTVNKVDIHSETRYKCVLVKDAKVITSTITIRNLASESIINLVTSTGSTVYPLNIGSVTIQAEYYNPGYKGEDNRTLKCAWQRLDKNGDYLDSNFYEVVSNNAFENRDGKYFFVNAIKYNVSKIDEANIIGCTLYFESFDDNKQLKQQILGTKWITITTKEISTGRIVVTNGDKLYKYDADGDSPMVADYDGPLSSAIKQIDPISIRIFNESGVELTDDEYKTVKVSWLIPTDSMIVVSGLNSPVEPDKAINLGYATYTGSYYELNNFSYSISSTFNKNKANNGTIIIKATAPVAVLKEEVIGVATIRFLKDGEAGTNGSKYSAVIKYNDYGYNEKDIKGHIQKPQLVCLTGLSAGTIQVDDNSSNNINIDTWKVYDYDSKEWITAEVGDNKIISKFNLKLKLYVDGEPIEDSELENNSMYDIEWSIFDEDIDLLSSFQNQTESDYTKVRTPYLIVDKTTGCIELRKIDEIEPNITKRDNFDSMNEVENSEVINLLKELYKCEVNTNSEEEVSKNLRNLMNEDSEFYDEDFATAIRAIKKKLIDIYSINNSYLDYDDIIISTTKDNTNKKKKIVWDTLTKRIKTKVANKLNWKTKDDVFYAVIQVKAHIVANSTLNADEYVYAYYPIECSRIDFSKIKKYQDISNKDINGNSIQNYIDLELEKNKEHNLNPLSNMSNDEKLNLCLQSIPTMLGGFYKVLYASDGTNPQYDNSNPFVVSNLFFDGNEMFKYNWSSSEINLKCSPIKKNNIQVNSCRVTPQSKYDSGIAKNFVRVDIQKSDSYSIYILTKIYSEQQDIDKEERKKTYLSKLVNALKLIHIDATEAEMAQYIKDNGIDKDINFCYNKYVEKLEESSPLYQYKDCAKQILNSMNSKIDEIIESIKNIKNYEKDDFFYIKDKLDRIQIYKDRQQKNKNLLTEMEQYLGTNGYKVEEDGVETFGNYFDKFKTEVFDLEDFYDPYDTDQKETIIYENGGRFSVIENKNKKYATYKSNVEAYNNLVLDLITLIANSETEIKKYENKIDEILKEIKDFYKNLEEKLKDINVVEKDGKTPPNILDENDIVIEKNKYNNLLTNIKNRITLESNTSFIAKASNLNSVIKDVVEEIKKELEKYISKTVIFNYENRINQLSGTISNHYSEIDNYNIIKNEVPIIHIAPIIILYNRYEMSNLNGWDGNKLVINENDNYIIAPQIGAGKKENDNSFTGMVMGIKRVTGKQTIKSNQLVGLFGYSSGAQTLFLNSKDGSAIFGKSGAGQIIVDPMVDGSTVYPKGAGLIYSSAYWKNYNYDGKPKNYNKSNRTDRGMLIDLTTPEIRYGSGNFVVTKEGHLTAKGGGLIGGWAINDTQIYSYYNDNNKERIYLTSGGKPCTISEDLYNEVLKPDISSLDSIKNKNGITQDLKKEIDVDLPEKTKQEINKLLSSTEGVPVLEREFYFVKVQEEKMYPDDSNKLPQQYQLVDKNGNIIYYYEEHGSIYSGQHNTLTAKEAGFYLSEDGLSIGSKIKLVANGIAYFGAGAVNGPSDKHWTIDGSSDSKYSYIGYNATSFEVSGEMPEQNANADSTKIPTIRGRSNSVYIGTDGIRLGQHFAVDDLGNVIANYLYAKNGGNIAGWKISPTALYTENLYLSSEGAIYGGARATGTDDEHTNENSGWCIKADGKAYFREIYCVKNGTFGTGTSGSGGTGNYWKFTPSTADAGNFYFRNGLINMGTTKSQSYQNGTVSDNTDCGISVDNTGGTKTSVTIKGNIYANDGFFNGIIVAKKGGRIGGWEIGEDNLYSTTSVGQIGQAKLTPTEIIAGSIYALKFYLGVQQVSTQKIKTGDGNDVTVLTVANATEA